jgi:hypothetical protein
MTKRTMRPGGAAITVEIQPSQERDLTPSARTPVTIMMLFSPRDNPMALKSKLPLNFMLMR